MRSGRFPSSQPMDLAGAVGEVLEVLATRGRAEQADDLQGQSARRQSAFQAASETAIRSGGTWQVRAAQKQ